MVVPIFNIEALTPIINNVHLGAVGGGDQARKEKKHKETKFIAGVSFSVDSLV